MTNRHVGLYCAIIVLVAVELGTIGYYEEKQSRAIELLVMYKRCLNFPFVHNPNQNACAELYLYESQPIRGDRQ